jgi:zinc D-Ala-D-Ala carboxypeptidase
MRKLFKYLCIGLFVFIAGCSLKESEPQRNGEIVHDQRSGTFQGKEGPPKRSFIELEQEYFNNVAEVDGVPTIQNPENILVLATKNYVLPADFEPDNLVMPDVPFVFPGADQNFLRKEAASALEELFDAAKEESINIIARSGYRSYETQRFVFNRSVNKNGYDYTSLYVAKPGMSEHQTGLAIDITSDSVNQKLVQSFGQTKEGKWLAENAHKFGFILRYREDKEDITQYSYEPWHFRYVGKETARIIYENNLSLEEFFDVAHEI